MLQLQKADIPLNDTFEELVPLYNCIFGKMVNARELHLALGIRKKFSDWIKNYTKNYIGYDYGMTEIHPSNPNEFDYFSFVIPATKGKGKSVEYVLTLDMAKEIAMMTRSQKGNEIRKYFIAVDKAYQSMLLTLQNNTLSSQEKIAEALIISQRLLSQKDDEIRKANRNKEYNKKVNKRLRSEIKVLKSKIDNPIITNDEELKRIIKEKDAEIKMKEEEILFLEGSYENLEDKHTKLYSRFKNLISMKLDGKSILNAFAYVDIERRKRFAVGQKAKEEAKIKAYKFRKDAILNAGIIVNNSPNKNFIDSINVNDIENALRVYIDALRKCINNEELFEEIFKEQLKKTDVFFEKVNFEKENNELEECIS